MLLIEITLEQKVLYRRVSRSEAFSHKRACDRFPEASVWQKVSSYTKRRKPVGGGMTSAWFPRTPGRRVRGTRGRPVPKCSLGPPSL